MVPVLDFVDQMFQRCEQVSAVTGVSRTSVITNAHTDTRRGKISFRLIAICHLTFHPAPQEGAAAATARFTCRTPESRRRLQTHQSVHRCVCPDRVEVETGEEKVLLSDGMLDAKQNDLEKPVWFSVSLLEQTNEESGRKEEVDELRMMNKRPSAPPAGGDTMGSQIMEVVDPQ